MAIFPLNLNSEGYEGSHVDTVTPVSDEQQNKKKFITLRDLLHHNNRANRGQNEVLEQSGNSSNSFDDVSTIDLVSIESGTESNEYSLQGQPRSNETPTLSTATSTGNSGKSPQSGSQDSLGDYRQNFPYKPPRLTDTYPDRSHYTHLMRSVQPEAGGKRINVKKISLFDQTDSP